MTMVTAISRRWFDGPRYSSSVVVVVSEIMKMVCSVIFLRMSDGASKKPLFTELREMLPGKDVYKLALLAGLYVIQNNLTFVAITHLNVLVYQCTIQMKILAAAIFGVAMFGKKLSNVRWLAIVALTIGVTMVQVSQAQTGSSHGQSKGHTNTLVGLVSILSVCMISGFAGNFCEKFLKAGSDIWTRNFQIALISIPFTILALIVDEGSEILHKGFFLGFNYVTIMVIFAQTFSGMLSSLAMRNADNNAKAFAVAIGIVVSSWLSVPIFSIPTTILTYVGTLLVGGASVVYSIDPKFGGAEVSKTKE